MNQAVAGSQGICGRVGRAQHAVLDGCARPGCAKLHPSTSIEVAGVEQDFGQSLDAQLERFTGVQKREWISLFRDRSFHRMGDRVHAGAGGYSLGLR